MQKKIGKVSGLLRVLEEEDVEKKIDEAAGDDAADAAGDADTVEKVVEGDDEDGKKVDEAEGDEDLEKKDEQDPLTVDDDQTFVGENSDDEDDDLVLLLDESEEDGEKKEESEDEEKVEESDEEEKVEESDEEEEKLESLLKKFDIKASEFVECKAILHQLVTEKAERLTKKAEAKIQKSYAESNTRRLKKLQESVKTYARRAAAKFVEAEKAKFVERATFEAHSAFVDKISTLFGEFGIQVDPKIKTKFEGLKNEIKTRNLEIDRLNSKNEHLALKIEAHKIAGAIKTLTEGLTQTDSERFVRIVEGLEIKDYADFIKRATSVKEKVFSENSQDYNTFVESLDQSKEKQNLGIRTENSKPESLVNAAASILSGKHG
jgi:hypothetical protein